MADKTKLETPAGIATVRETKTKKITITWKKSDEELKLKNGPVFEFQFIKKSDMKTVETVTPKPTKTDKDGVKDQHEYEITVDDGTFTKLKNCLVEIKEVVPATPETEDVDKVKDKADSDWGREGYWKAGASLTIKIGSKSYTLSRETGKSADEEKGSSIYKLPVSVDHPMEITYLELKEFADGLGVSMPSEFPNGKPIGLSVVIYEFIVDTSNKFFSINISIKADWTIFDGLTIEKVGLVLKRTDGSI